MVVDELVVIVRSLMWFILSWVMWFGLRDYFMAKYKRNTRRWAMIKIALGLIIIANFFILVLAIIHGFGGV